MTGKKRKSPERIIKAENSKKNLQAMIESQTINVGDSGAAFDKLKE